MDYKNNLINNLPKIYREDKWIEELFGCAGVKLEQLVIDTEDLKKQFWFDTMTWAIPTYEKLLGIKTNPNTRIEDRRSFIEAKWKSSGKCTLDLIKAVANSFYGGSVDITFVGGKIKVTFVSLIGIPPDINSFKQAIEDLKPAHIPLLYEFKYRRHEELRPRTHGSLKPYAHKTINGGVI